jgi:hypothetical protein
MGRYFNEKLMTRKRIPGQLFPAPVESLLNSELEEERRQFNSEPRPEEKPKPKKAPEPVADKPVNVFRPRRYYRPDNSEVLAMPELTVFVIKDEQGNVMKAGTRDRLLDKWTLEKRKVPWVTCPYCSDFHANQADCEHCRQLREAGIYGDNVLDPSKRPVLEEMRAERRKTTQAKKGA